MPLDQPNELDVQDRIADAIWFVPASDDAQAHYVFEYSGRGPKAYLNLWLGKEYGEELTEWNWVLYPSAVELWRQHSTDKLRAENERLRAAGREVIDVLRAILARHEHEKAPKRRRRGSMSRVERSGSGVV